MSSLPLHSDELPLPRASRLWWLIPAAALAIAVIAVMLLGGDREKSGARTSYDASDNGFRGIYLILEELGYPVERSRKAGGGEVRWILFPTTTSARESAALESWIREGGRALLAVNDDEFAKQLGLDVAISYGTVEQRRARVEGAPFATAPWSSTPARSSDPDLDEVYAGPLEVEGPPGGRVWGRLDGKPLVTIYPRGRGEVWLLHRPDVLVNANVRQGDNSVLACRLAEAMLAGRPHGRLAFDEYCHGLHDRPDVFQLLFRPPVRAVTLEALVLMALILWHSGVRFGVLRRVPPPPRRSKEEFLNAMADLLTRKCDRSDAFTTIRDDFIRRLELELGLPAGTSIEHTVREAVRRRGWPREPLVSLCSSDPKSGMSAKAFLQAIHQLAELDAKK